MKRFLVLMTAALLCGMATIQAAGDEKNGHAYFTKAQLPNMAYILPAPPEFPALPELPAPPELPGSTASPAPFDGAWAWAAARRPARSGSSPEAAPWSGRCR